MKTKYIYTGLTVILFLSVSMGLNFILSSCNEESPSNGAGTPAVPVTDRNQPPAGGSGNSNPDSTSPPHSLPNVNLSEIANRPEFKDHLSAEGTKYSPEVVNRGLFPKGSAIVSQSGNLNARGIRKIIHAASGSSASGSADGEPTLDSIGLSVKNSIILTHRLGEYIIAVPLIGGGIFGHRVFPSETNASDWQNSTTAVTPYKQKIADTIVQSAIREAVKIHQEGGHLVKVVFVAPGAAEKALFDQAFNSLASEIPAKNNYGEVRQVSITSNNGIPVIVNAGNTEGQFGGGVSGAIGNATGIADQINNELRDLRTRFNAEVKRQAGN